MRASTLAAGQTRSNGIGLTPDERTLYVANSGWPQDPLLMSYPVLDDLTLGDAAVLFDATGPGDVLVSNAKGKHLGTIELNEVAANVAWDDGKTLYIAASTSLYRIKRTAEGLVYRQIRLMS